MQFPALDQIVIDLAAAKNDAGDAGFIERRRIFDDQFELTLRKIAKWRHRELVAQQALGCHDDQRFAE